MRVLSFLVLISVTTSPAAAASPHPQGIAPLQTAKISPSPSPAVLLAHWEKNYRTPLEYVVAKFAGHQWVFLGEYHRVKSDVDLVSSLIPALHEKTDVRHLALEFLCRDRTGEANRLVAAGEFTRARALAFFRSQFVSWSYEEYLGIFESAWRSNQRWGDERGPFRLVGLNPCLDWELIHYGADGEAMEREREKHRRYDEIMAEALEAGVLEPDVPALVFTGIAHATAKFPEYWAGTRNLLPRMGNLVYREPYREKMFFVCLHAPFYDSATGRDIYPFDGTLDTLMRTFQRDVGFDVVGTPFEAVAHRERSTGSITEFTFGELYDGYILFRTPIKEYVGVTCIDDWIPDEEAFRQFWRNLANKEASQCFSEIPFPEFRADFCAPRPDHGAEFRRRFRDLPDLPAP